MAIIFPSKINQSIVRNHSYGEWEILTKFHDLPNDKTRNWIVFYSYAFKARNERFTNDGTIIYDTNEIDFIVLAPNYGLFIIEVKGGKISKKDGLIYSMDQNGNEHAIEPFKQVKDNFFKLKHFLNEKAKINLDKFFCDYFIAFPDIDGPLDFGLQSDGKDIIYKKTDLYSFIKNSSSKNNKKNFNKHGFSEEEVNTIKKLLLGDDFEFSISEKDKVFEINTDIDHKTEEENKRNLQLLIENPRCLIKGLAGSGKTYLAKQLYDYYVSQGKNVLYIVFNHKLSLTVNKSLNSGNCKELFPYLESLYMSDGIKSNLKDKVDNFKLYEKTIYDWLRDRHFDNKYDILIIDEFQDIKYQKEIEYFFNEIINGGLDNGSWYFFFDERQNLFVEEDEKSLLDMVNVLNSNYRASRFTLFGNIRNTKEIADIINNAQMCEKANAIDFKKLFSNSNDAKYSCFNTSADAFNNICEYIDDLRKLGIKNENITILSDTKPEKSETIKLLKDKYKNDLVYYEPFSNKMTYSTLRSYKGLDNSVIIYIKDSRYSNFADHYVAISRAKIKLYVVEIKPIYNKVLKYDDSTDTLIDTSYNFDPNENIETIICNYSYSDKVISSTIDRAKIILRDNDFYDFKITNNCISAGVEGEKDIYDVSISKESGNLSFKCNCNYFLKKDTYLCKHIIALILKVKSIK